MCTSSVIATFPSTSQNYCFSPFIRRINSCGESRERKNEALFELAKLESIISSSDIFSKMCSSQKLFLCGSNVFCKSLRCFCGFDIFNGFNTSELLLFSQKSKYVCLSILIGIRKMSCMFQTPFTFSIGFDFPLL